MAVRLNHTIVYVPDRDEGAHSFAELMGLDPPTPAGRFLAVTLAGGVTLDHAAHPGEITLQHYAFLVGESDFDRIYGLIQQRDIPHWADPRQEHPGEINTNDGGRGVYWQGPGGHYLEIITAPYGSGS